MKQSVKQGATKKAPTKKAPEASPVKQILLELGDKFRRARQDQNMTFEALAKASGVSTLYISNLEKGKYDNMGLDVLHRLADALGLELSVEAI